MPERTTGGESILGESSRIQTIRLASPQTARPFLIPRKKSRAALLLVSMRCSSLVVPHVFGDQPLPGLAAKDDEVSAVVIVL